MNAVTTAQRMYRMYGKHWSIHATYNLMQYDRDHPNYAFWKEVLNQEPT